MWWKLLAVITQSKMNVKTAAKAADQIDSGWTGEINDYQRPFSTFRLIISFCFDAMHFAFSAIRSPLVLAAALIKNVYLPPRVEVAGLFLKRMLVASLYLLLISCLHASNAAAEPA